jgi:hypothetical protein
MKTLHAKDAKTSEEIKNVIEWVLDFMNCFLMEIYSLMEPL